jgi:hypothetical protein
MPDIFLYAGEPNPNDIRLRDPTTSGGGGTAWTVNLSDTVTLSDSRIKAVGKLRSDTTTLSDAVVKAVGKIRSDTITLTDAAARSIHVARSDTITLTDARSKVVGKPLSDAITLSDFITVIPGGVNYTVNLSDAITLTDAIAVVVPPLPPFPPVFLGGGGTEIGHPRMRGLKSELKHERRDDEIEELEIVAILTCWLGKN